MKIILPLSKLAFKTKSAIHIPSFFFLIALTNSFGKYSIVLILSPYLEESIEFKNEISL